MNSTGPTAPESNSSVADEKTRFLRILWDRAALAFLGCSLADAVLTYLLLMQGGHREANPIAKYILDHWGLAGMFRFKAGMTAFVLIIAVVIARRHWTAARRLLWVASGIVLIVVLYSLFLWLRSG